MKKKKKSMESTSIRIYEDVMRKLLLNNLIVFIFLSLAIVSTVVAASPVFLILNDGVDATDLAESLEYQGARVRQRIPPNILVGDLPDNLKPRTIQGVKSAYSGVVPISILEPMGITAVAAGTEWNRTMLRASKAAGVSAFGTMRSQVAQKSLPGPKSMTITNLPPVVRASWDGIDSALYYEVEMALDAGFNNRVALTQTNRSEVELPAPVGTGALPVYLRVRGADRVEGEELFGSYSTPTSASVSAVIDNGTLPAPTLSSPVPNHTTEGFTMILEWNAGVAANSRVQVSKQENFSTTLVDQMAAGGTFVVPSQGLKVGDVIFWRVKSWGISTSGWSEVRKITIGEPHFSTASHAFENPEAPK